MLHHIPNSLWITKSSLFAHAVPRGRAIGIKPIVPRAGFIGVEIVPAELEESAAHAKQLDIRGHIIWIGANNFETAT